ncbi:MAG: nucleotidyltransferase domain-containing protein [Salinarimonas sp.]
MTDIDARCLAIAEGVVEELFPNALGAWWSGSLAQGRGTATSDIDLVVLMPSLRLARRETIVREGRLVEIFVQTSERARRFFALDAERGIPSLAHMIATGIALRDAPEARALAAAARETLERGPRPLEPREIETSRYVAADLASDLRGARDATEARAIGIALYPHAFDFLRRSKRAWSARGKRMVMVLREEEGALGLAFLAAFDALFERGERAHVLALVEEIWAPVGGPLETMVQEAGF